MRILDNMEIEAVAGGEGGDEPIACVTVIGTGPAPNMSGSGTPGTPQTGADNMGRKYEK